MRGFEYLWEAISDIPSFVLTLYFKLGWASVFFCAFLLFFIWTAWMARKDKSFDKEIENDLLEYRQRSLNLKRYARANKT